MSKIKHDQPAYQDLIDEIAKIIVDACFKIHTTLGPGLLESVYESILARELQNRGLQVARQSPLPITW